MLPLTALLFAALSSRAAPERRRWAAEVLVPRTGMLAEENGRFEVIRAKLLPPVPPYTSFDSPASVRIRVYQVLRGRANPRDTEAILAPPLRSEMMKDPRHGDYALKDEWRKEPFLLPPADTVLLMARCCVDHDEPPLHVQGHAVLWSPENEAKLAGTLEPPPAPARRQSALFALVLAAALLANLPLPWFGARSVVFLAAAALYAWYESGVPRLTDIRVDLLFLWPALLVAFIGAARSMKPRPRN